MIPLILDRPSEVTMSDPNREEEEGRRGRGWGKRGTKREEGREVGREGRGGSVTMMRLIP
jgi:hypothetical protein